MNIAKARPYVYAPLLPHPNSIRLLRLLPSSLADDPICCQLFNYSLAVPHRSSHLYECLSYVWGSTSDRKPISIDGSRLDVTQSLHGALRRLRDPFLDRILWVDALCINQDDLEERAQQVQFMAMIYAFASRVNIWLGEEADGSCTAMQMIREEASPHRYQDDEYSNSTYLETESESTDENEIIANSDGKDVTLTSLNKVDAEAFAEDVVSIDQIEIDADAYVEVEALLKRPWFHRIWVIWSVSLVSSTYNLAGASRTGGGTL